MIQQISATDLLADERLAVFQQMGIVLEGERILEFGAREGALAALMESQGNAVTAIEAGRGAFERIVTRDKIHGGAKALSGLTQKFDRLVAVDALQYLPEADVRRVLAEAARLAGGVLIVVATDESATAARCTTRRPASWWTELVAEHFDVQAFPGIAPGQLVLAGDRRVAQAASAPAQHADDFGLPSGYATRATPAIPTPITDGAVTWQPDVYPTAANIARSLECDTLIDIGCDQVNQLKPLQSEFRLIGLGRGASTTAAAQAVPSGIWLEVDPENLDLSEMPADVLARSVVVCSEMIQTVVDPRSLLAALRHLLKHAPALVLSTPDRERTYGKQHKGPPPNQSHVRQWSLAELRALLEREGFVLASSTHTRSNVRSKDLSTAMIVAINPEHPAMRGSEFVRRADAAPAKTAQAAARPQALPELVIGDVQGAAAAASSQAAAHPRWHERLGKARDDRETLRTLARMSLALGHPDRAMELYGALLSTDDRDSDALEGAVLSRMRCGQHDEAARILGSVTRAN
jgi:2-polyprenyl-3-methyl-5-hydroxy-6-metoxy-1,4-benzoquinol methylase